MTGGMMTSATICDQYRQMFDVRFGDVPTHVPVLPATSAQRRFTVAAEYTGRRLVVPLAFSLPSGLLDLDQVQTRVHATAQQHPALRCVVDYDGGVIVQRWQPDRREPCSAVKVGDPADELAQVRRLVREAAAREEPEPFAAHLLRGRDQDRLLVILDHTVVDETSLRVIGADLFAEPKTEPLNTVSDRWEAYRDAVWQRFEQEAAAAANATSMRHWINRLVPLATGIHHRFPVRDAPARGSNVREIPPVAFSMRLRPTLFLRLLASLHWAIQAEYGTPTGVTYAWGARPGGTSTTVGCFMNTLLSVDPSDPQTERAARWTAFRTATLRDFDHADVPFDAVVTEVNRTTRSGWSGSSTALLVFEDLTPRAAVAVSGHLVEEWLPPWLEPKTTIGAAVRYDGSALALRLTHDPNQLDTHDIAKLGDRWRETLVSVLQL